MSFSLLFISVIPPNEGRVSYSSEPFGASAHDPYFWRLSQWLDGPPILTDVTMSTLRWAQGAFSTKKMDSAICNVVSKPGSTQKSQIKNFGIAFANNNS